jgi:CheY-like chemotaxis protein
LHILAADDARINRELLRQLTAYFGYQSEIVENGAEVIKALNRASFDLVLMDVQMPVMDGLEAAREIGRLQPDFSKRPKIVALTANSDPVDQAACLAAVMDACLAKPLSPRAFESCVLSLFGGTPDAPRPPLPPIPSAKFVPLPLVDFMHLEAALPGVPAAQLTAIARRMHSALIKDFESVWPQVVDAIDRQDQERLATSLHALKGCFSALGWKRISCRCAEALQRARAGQFDEWATLPLELKQLYAASAEEMARRFAKAAQGDPPASAAKET